jgi:predicted MFS family arabinose efflux permease
MTKFFRWLSSPTGVAVCAIGIVQIIVWGTSFYSLGVLAHPIIAETGWSNTLVFAGLTIGLLASSAISTLAGGLIDRAGARLVMTLGSVLLALTLALVAISPTVWWYLAAWVAVGIAMRLTLYDAAFAAMVQVSPEGGRRAIAFLTLFGGFASTVFWLIGHQLVTAFDWRTTYWIFAALNLFLAAPLCYVGLARREPTDTAPQAASATTSKQPVREPLEGRSRTIAMALFCLVMSGNALIFGVGAVHLVGLIEASGVALALAVSIASLKGAAQVAGRVWEIIWGRNLDPVNLGRIAIALLPFAFVVLLWAGADWLTAAAFTLIFGASNGLVTIVRGAVPLALFGAEGYGKVLGIIATPVLLFNALAPMMFAAIVEAWGYRTGTYILFVLALLSAVAMEGMAVWYRRHLARTATSANTATGSHA